MLRSWTESAPRVSSTRYPKICKVKTVRSNAVEERRCCVFLVGSQRSRLQDDTCTFGLGRGLACGVVLTGRWLYCCR